MCVTHHQPAAYAARLAGHENRRRGLNLTAKHAVFL
jgi:hypothetical protein